MNYFNFKEKSILSELATLIITIVILIFIEPALYFGLGYFSGWIAKITIGTFLVNGINTIGIPITKEQLPLISGVIAWIGSFFKGEGIKFNLKKESSLY